MGPGCVTRLRRDFLLLRCLPDPGMVFLMRALDPARRFIILRKLLDADNIRPGITSEESLHSKNQPRCLTETFSDRTSVVAGDRNGQQLAPPVALVPAIIDLSAVAGACAGDRNSGAG